MSLAELNGMSMRESHTARLTDCVSNLQPRFPLIPRYPVEKCQCNVYSGQSCVQCTCLLCCVH